MKEVKYFNNRGFMSKNLISLLDMLVTNDGLHSEGINLLKTELDHQRRLQGIYNVLFGIIICIVVVMWRVL